MFLRQSIQQPEVEFGARWVAHVMADKDKDRNNNASRHEAKLLHKNFSLALSKLPKDHEAHTILKNLPRKKKADFYQNWSKDPTWSFVRVFKTSSVAAVDTDKQKTV